MNNIVIYTKSYCPYCIAAKRVLQARDISFQEIDVEFNEKKRDEMISKSGRYTVPQIFSGDQHIGGYDDLVAHFSQNKAA